MELEANATIAVSSFLALLVFGVLVLMSIFADLSSRPPRLGSRNHSLSSSIHRHSRSTDNPSLPLLEREPTEPPSDLCMKSPRAILYEFVFLSICFSANHGAVTGCIGLATNRFATESWLGADLGTWQTGTLYLTYALSAVSGAAYFVRKVGSRNGILAGLVTYCVYVTAFLVAVLQTNDAAKWPITLIGAAVGGVGGGILWTAQGNYFFSMSEAYACSSRTTTAKATSYLGGVFAFFYLYLEVLMKVLASVIVESDTDGDGWITVFAVYTAVSVLACAGVSRCHKFPVAPIPEEEKARGVCAKITGVTRILFEDPKMKFMIPLNAVFGAASGFTVAFVSGQVVHASGKDEFIGALTAVPPAVAAVMSLVLGRIGQATGKGVILISGALCFAGMAGCFLLSPGLVKGWGFLIAVYALMGCGRATFESTLRATFADFFANDTEGAFSNIVLQSGLSSSLAFFLFPHITCGELSEYCVEYQDGTRHNVAVLACLVIGLAVLAIGCYARAARIYGNEQRILLD